MKDSFEEFARKFVQLKCYDERCFNLMLDALDSFEREHDLAKLIKYRNIKKTPILLHCIKAGKKNFKKEEIQKLRYILWQYINAG